jgi:hypothetical protein
MRLDSLHMWVGRGLVKNIQTLAERYQVGVTGKFWTLEMTGRMYDEQ